MEIWCFLLVKEQTNKTKPVSNKHSISYDVQKKPITD